MDHHPTKTPLRTTTSIAAFLYLFCTSATSAWEITRWGLTNLKPWSVLLLREQYFFIITNNTDRSRIIKPQGQYRASTMHSRFKITTQVKILEKNDFEEDVSVYVQTCLISQYMERQRIAWMRSIITPHIIGIIDNKYCCWDLLLLLWVVFYSCISTSWCREMCKSSSERTWKLREGYETEEQWRQKVKFEMSRLSEEGGAGSGKVCSQNPR